ncbi:MAG: ATP-binding protein, partial [Spirochaetales bacterium]|nr:ATP-binding protein [Spirochaetales bacterium]
GQTAQVLRNICYKVSEADAQNGTNDWGAIAEIMHRLFWITLNKPAFNESRGNLVLTYRSDTMDNRLDISLAGRGLQQILLILAYLYWHKDSVILIDEPDAHLEILRQKQIYALLRNTAQENKGQVIIATHSEAILDDAIDVNLTLLLNGKADDLAEKHNIRNALRTYGIEHYYKSKVHPRILYIEGSTDVEILKALALHTKNEKAEKVLNDRLNLYYTRNIEPEDTLDNQLDRINGFFRKHHGHFNALKTFVPELKGFALFDSDNIMRDDVITQDFATLYWKFYELENYFISPKALVEFAAARFGKAAGELFFEENLQTFIETVDEALLEAYFNHDREQLDGYNNMIPNLQRNFLSTKKISDFAENVFRRYGEKTHQPMLLTKGEFYRLVPFCPAAEIPKEVTEKLNLLAKYLEYPAN